MVVVVAAADVVDYFGIAHVEEEDNSDVVDVHQ